MVGSHRFLALTLSIIFGLGWVFGKAALDHFPPIIMAAFRFGCAGLAMLPFCKWKGLSLKEVIILSVLSISIPYSLSNYSLSQLDVSVTVMLAQMEAPILIVMSALFLREIPSRTIILGVVVSFIGVTFVAGRPVVSGSFFPVILAVVSMVIWSTGQLMIRRLSLTASFSLLGALSLLAAPQLVILSFVFGEPQIQSVWTASATNWLQVVYLGIVMTAGGIGTWYFLISRHPINLVAPYLLLVPAVSIIGGALFLGERPTLETIAGGGLIIVGVAIASFFPGRNATTPGSRLEKADEYC
ncbi:EamA family transporter [Mycolicibacterium aubagnense]